MMDGSDPLANLVKSVAEQHQLRVSHQAVARARTRLPAFLNPPGHPGAASPRGRAPAEQDPDVSDCDEVEDPEVEPLFISEFDEWNADGSIPDWKRLETRLVLFLWKKSFSWTPPPWEMEKLFWKYFLVETEISPGIVAVIVEPIHICVAYRTAFSSILMCHLSGQRAILSDSAQTVNALLFETV